MVPAADADRLLDDYRNMCFINHTTSRGADSMQTTHQQGVRLFVSFDLVGSTAIKSRQMWLQEPDREDERVKDKVNKETPQIFRSGHWMNIFFEFFKRLPEELASALDQQFDKFKLVRCGLDIWRITGDEILFVSNRIEKADQVLPMALAIYTILNEFDKEFQDLYGLGVKAAVWAAGFPIRNTEITVHPYDAPYVRTNSPFYSTSDYPLPRSDYIPERSTVIREFLGPEIDLGFRLSQLAVPRRLLVSIEIANTLSQYNGYDVSLLPRFFLVGWATLKGLYRETPYPLVWIDYEKKSYPKKRNSFEEYTSPYCQTYFSETCEKSQKDIRELHDEYLRDTKDTRIGMYFSTDKDNVAPDHEQKFRHLRDES